MNTEPQRSHDPRFAALARLWAACSQSTSNREETCHRNVHDWPRETDKRIPARPSCKECPCADCMRYKTPSLECSCGVVSACLISSAAFSHSDTGSTAGTT